MRSINLLPLFLLSLVSACTTWPMPQESRLSFKAKVMMPPLKADDAVVRPAPTRRVFVCGRGAYECTETDTLILGTGNSQFFIEGRFADSQFMNYPGGRQRLLQPDGDPRQINLKGISNMYVWATPFTYMDPELQAGETEVHICDAAFKVTIGGAP